MKSNHVAEFEAFLAGLAHVCERRSIDCFSGRPWRAEARRHRSHFKSHGAKFKTLVRSLNAIYLEPDSLEDARKARGTSPEETENVVYDNDYWIKAWHDATNAPADMRLLDPYSVIIQLLWDVTDVHLPVRNIYTNRYLHRCRDITTALCALTHVGLRVVHWAPEVSSGVLSEKSYVVGMGHHDGIQRYIVAGLKIPRTGYRLPDDESPDVLFVLFGPSLTGGACDVLRVIALRFASGRSLSVAKRSAVEFVPQDYVPVMRIKHRVHVIEDNFATLPCVESLHAQVSLELVENGRVLH